MSKKLFFILFFLVSLGLTSFAQNKGTQSSTQYKVVLSGTCLEIHVIDTALFNGLDEGSKKILIETNAKKFQGVKTAVIRNGYNREIWIREKDSSFYYSFAKDINDFCPTDVQRKTNAIYSKADFFAYLGAGMDFSSSHFTFNVSSRFGCYFFRRLLDASVTYTYSILVSDGSNFSSMNLGLMARIYPFFKTAALMRVRISPYVGAEISWQGSFVEGNLSNAATINFVAGFSWFIGPGTFDIGVQGGFVAAQDFEGNFFATIGYSFCPSLISSYRKSKKK